MEDESRSVPRALSVEMMDERAWPASRLEELVFKRGVSGKIDIIISQARILSHSLFLFLFCFSSRNRPFDFRRTSKARERVLIDCEANNLPRTHRFIRDIHKYLWERGSRCCHASRMNRLSWICIRIKNIYTFVLFVVVLEVLRQIIILIIVILRTMRRARLASGLLAYTSASRCFWEI